MVAAMFKGQQPSGSAAKFDMLADGGTLKLNVFIPEEELKKSIQSDIAALSPSTAPTAAPRPAPPAAPKPAATQVLDKEGNTVVLRLPGKE